MKIVWSWLLELVELSTPVDAARGAELLTAAGLEVETTETLGDDFSGVVVAEVVAKRPHPNADRLTVVDVIDRQGGSATQVVCGAPNVPAPGGRVLWAKPGARLPGGMEIGSRALKGVESAGMLCSEKELGIGEGDEGIAVLTGEEARAALGISAQDALSLRDSVFDLSIPSNRPDALGHLGVARELVAAAGGVLRPLAVDLSHDTDGQASAESLIQIAIDDPAGCPRYVARVIDGVTVGPSPGWMKRRLRAVGVRPLSNLVDVTNYVLFEVGQPLHAFDYRQVRGGQIRVRRATAGESIVTLDGEKRALEAGDLVICDRERPVALAGVMGGQDSEVRDDTTRVLLESAAFDPGSVRRTAKRLGLHSESSHRFERGVDPAGADHASRRAAQLIAQLGGGTIAGGAVDLYPGKAARKTVALRPSRASRLAGIEISPEIAKQTLERLGLAVSVGQGDDELLVEQVGHRGDLTREVDLIEDLLRLHGLDKIPATLPTLTAAPSQTLDPRLPAARRALTALGFCEAITFAFTSPERTAALRLAPGDARHGHVVLQNPMSSDQSVLRTSLLPNLLAALAKNLKHEVKDVALFEIGTVFFPRGEDLPEEPLRVAGIVGGTRPGWLGSGGEVDFFDAKGAVERIYRTVAAAGAPDLRFDRTNEAPYLHPGIAAQVSLPDGTHLGEVGEVHPEVRAAFDIEPACFVFDLDFAKLPTPGARQMTAIPRFPAVTRDISLFVDQSQPASRLGELVAEAADPLIEAVTVLEEYRDPVRVPPGQKGLLWSITYRSGDRTLTVEEVDTRHQALVGRLVDRLGATLR